ncbi:MAG: radical SAM family heme chaperone HemW [Elusimicrobia bacterium]|nr:radical SAM family heme chaperone HemW [Elusimicrobiota bacterium]
MSPKPGTGAQAATGLYLHVPFCSVKCRFCDFAAYPGRRGEISRYLESLSKEIAQRAEENPRSLDTLYVGGGTPSLLSGEEIGRLLAEVDRRFSKTPEFESSLECNPETLTVEKLEALRRAGVNRLSLGLQTTEDPLLKALGRSHDLRTFHGAYRAARDVGFGNLNIDLMYGLPGQTRTGWMDTVKRVIDLAPEHVSAYALTVQEETYFHRSGVVPDDDLQADMYEEAADALIAAGFGHYEISNFAKPGRECRHNLRYWRNQDCLGAGVSAARYDGRTRRTNTDNLSVYLLAMEGGQTPVVEETALTEAERLGEDLMLGLRLAEGVAPSAAAARLYGAALEEALAEGLLRKEGGRYFPSRKGWRLSNALFVKLLAPGKPAS